MMADWIPVARALGLDVADMTPADSFEIYSRVLRDDAIRHLRVRSMRQNLSIAELIHRLPEQERDALRERVLHAHIDLRGPRFIA